MGHTFQDHPLAPYASSGNELRVYVYVTPGSRVEGIMGTKQGRIWVCLQSLPHEGKANQALLKLFSTLLAVPIARVNMRHSTKGRLKVIRIMGQSSQCEQWAIRIGELCSEKRRPQ